MNSEEEPMVEIKAGPELDRAVAEAVGWRFTAKKVVRDSFDVVAGTLLEGWWDGDDYISYQTPECSTDLNAAFAAAEKVGLFHNDRHNAMLATVEDNQWEVLWSTDDDDSVIAPTPALAICAAILKLKENQRPG